VTVSPPLAPAEITDWYRIDDAYRAYLESVDDPPWGSLVDQTIVTGPHRRSLFAALAIEPGWTIVDLGTGFGPIPLEFVHIAPVRVIGVDIDDRLLHVAESTATLLDTSGWSVPGASAEFMQCGAEHIPLPGGSVDLVTARLLFQHVADPSAIAREAFRVLRHGGRIVTYDVDDGLSATWPPESAETALLDAAYDAMQRSRGGDREVGRKLPQHFADAGFAIDQICCFPQTSFAASTPNDEFRRVSIARYRSGREGMIATGLLDDALFERCLSTYESEAAVARCRIESQVAVVARKP
jgi:ubiquinone/menaquinone biosynthesis C-methylase UbiE